MARKRQSTHISLDPTHRLLFDSAKIKGAKATCFFNNKGGVGKTTLVANLAAELAINFDAKILVVDADPQCNLTQYVIDEARLIEIYGDEDPKSIYSVVRPLALGKGYSENLPTIKSESFEFDLIVGDPRLALQEDLLAGDWKDAKGGGMRGIRTTYVFADLVRKAKESNYDFVFFDMGPSLGAINRSILLAMDYFLVPMAVDIFSLWAVKNMGSIISVWQKQMKTGMALAEEPEDIQNLGKVDSLKFLGYVTQQHKERVDNMTEDEEGFISQTRRIVQAYNDFNEKYPSEIQKHLHTFYNSKSLDPHIGDNRHLGSLAPMSQSQHSPMISVKGTGSYTQLRKQAREIYRHIAVNYLQNLVAS